MTKNQQRNKNNPTPSGSGLTKPKKQQRNNNPNITGTRPVSSQNKAKPKSTKIQIPIFKQINLQKKISATHTYLKELKTNEFIFAQEPHTKNNNINTFPKTHKIFKPTSKEPIRSFIAIPKALEKNTYMLSQFTNKDTTTIKSQFTGKDNNKNTMIMASQILLVLMV